MDWSWAEEGLKWIKNLGVFTLGTATITTIMGYFFKTVFTHVLNKESEIHKSMLNQQTEHYKLILNQQTEHYKAELQRINNKHQITFSKLHADRAETIKELYRILVKLQESAYDILGSQGIVNETIDKSIDEPTMRELVLKAKNESNDLHEKYKINRIYFSEDICKLIESIIIQMQVIVSYLLDDPFNNNERELEEVIALQERTEEIVAQRILDEIPKLKKALEDEFRKLLGVIEE
ncbi:hypothetical protein EXW62_27390 (plasmid) [Bacillus mycoides]|uniref:hypothetical protein n=1 Tax=Bacillus mycoides TaxID=1405 RepID=UPI001C00D3D0|nr:hypothetical protein [Bacillus mycoides]QWH20724.1 hypothetical protein EXW62_27390 [Bacillus mycoides]